MFAQDEARGVRGRVSYQAYVWSHSGGLHGEVGMFDRVVKENRSPLASRQSYTATRDSLSVYYTLGTVLDVCSISFQLHNKP